MQLIALFVLLITNVKLNEAANNTKSCQCVSIFLCEDDSEDELDDRNTDGRPLRSVTKRRKEDCGSDLEICCEPERLKITRTKQINACGIRNLDDIDSRLANSGYNQTKFGEFPWTIAVLHNTPDKQDEYICDGAMIHRKVVLTSAHCVNGEIASKLKIRAGEWDTQAINEILPHQDRAIETILIHANYSSRLLHNDVALLFLSRSLEITKSVNVICMPKSVDEVETSKCVVSGWGKNKLDGSYEKVLKKMDLQMVPRASCQKPLRQSGIRKNFLLDNSFICGGDKLGNSMWKSDGGSPFVCPLKINRHRFVLIGISAQNIGRSTRIANIFASVLQVRSWIDEKLLFHNLDNSEYQYG